MEDKVRTLLQYFLSLHEANAVMDMLFDEEYYGSDIIEYIKWCKLRYNHDMPTDFGLWLEDRIPRVVIGFSVTEYGAPVSGTLVFPKRSEDMDHGTEFEWYYSLREMTDKIMALKVGETIPFKIRDDENSVGSVT